MLQICLYQIRNDINSKLYVGITTTSLALRMQNHVSLARQGTPRPLYVDMRQFGIEHFLIEELEIFEVMHWADAERRERALIHQMGTLHPQGYNLSAPLSFSGQTPEGPGEWITAKEAAAFLSEINGRSISLNQVYQMALDGRIHSLIAQDTSVKLFWKPDLQGRIIRIRTDRPKRTMTRVRDQRSGRPGGRPRKNAAQRASIPISPLSRKKGDNASRIRAL